MTPDNRNKQMHEKLADKDGFCIAVLHLHSNRKVVRGKVNMNKLLIVLLAVCLVSVHAFVKRDAPADKPLDLSGVAKDFQDKLQDIGKQLETTFDPEKIKKGVNDLIDGFNKAIKDNNKPAA